MKPLRHPSDFLSLASAHCSRAAARACREGTYTKPVRVTLPGLNPGWQFVITSLQGAKWEFYIELLEEERRYRVHYTKVR